MSPPPQQYPVARLSHRTRQAERELPAVDWSTPVDQDRWYVCPTLTPLYYAPIYQELTDTQRLRYNQFTAVCFNELIAFFETSFASSVLAALSKLQSRRLDQEFSDCLTGFIEDEQKHIQWWRQLNQLSEPNLYANTQQVIIRFSPWAKKLLKLITTRPIHFPVVFWIMLALEERSLDISRRTLHMDAETIEPRYRMIYREHLKDEARHVQLDWHLIERFYVPRRVSVRRMNAWLLKQMLGRFFLPPTRSAVRVVQWLAREDSWLASRLPEIKQQLKQVGSNPAYHEMMYSRKTTPILFSLFDQYPELQIMQQVLKSYSPHGKEG